jgi:hypothetical protein
VLMQYALSSDRAAFADSNRHPLLPAALLRRIESSDPSLASVVVEGDQYSKYVGSRLVAGLADALSLNTCITSLSLAGNKLGSAGIKTLMAAVTHLQSLSSLDVGSNMLGCDGATALMAAVTRLTRLTSLNLGRNELSADDGARVCGAAAAAGMTLLAALELDGNGFSATHVVGCAGWREAGLSCSSDCVFFPSSFSVLMQYALSSDRAAFAESDVALSVVFIKNATGEFSFGINGPFVCTSQDSLGHAVYSKLGDGSVCIELFNNYKWQIKDVSNIGIDNCLAEVKVNRNSSLLEDCISEKWSVIDNGRRDVKMLTGADARREVSSLCMIALQPCHVFPSHIYPLLPLCNTHLFFAGC